MRHCYYPAAHSADPHLRLRDWAGGGIGGIGGGNGSGVSDIEGVLDGEEEKELRLNAGRKENFESTKSKYHDLLLAEKQGQKAPN